MFRFAINNGVIVTVAILIVCLFGVLAVFRVPIQMIPDLDVRTITVETSWPGATPQDVEKEIIIEQEEYLRVIPGLERMISRATTGSATIELEFPHGTGVNEVLIRVNNALAQVPEYPENVDEPRILSSSLSETPFMWFRIMPLPGNPKHVNMVLMRDFIDDHVRTRIERVAGVSSVEFFGGAERQIRIYVDPAKLAERSLSIGELRDAIRSRNRDVSGGDLDSGKRRYLLRTVGRFETLEDVEDMVVAERDGSFIRLRDIGYAELDHAEVRSYSLANGRSNITMGLRRQVGTNVIEVMDDVMAEVGELNATLMKQRGLQIELTSEDVQYVRDAVQVVGQNLAIGALLAVGVLFLFLRSPSATLLGATGIPICAIAAFLGLLLTGRTINVISLAGVAFAIGMTLDNSIVVLENIYRHMAQGKARLAAALEGVREVWTAVLASTLTTVFVFLPIIFVEQEAGQLYSDIAIAIAASIIMSMIVAITVIPTACGRYLTPHHGQIERASTDAFGGAFGRTVLALVRWLMNGAMRRVVVVVLVLTVSVGIIWGLTPPAEYLPEGEEQKTFAFMFAPPGYNLEEMTGYLEELTDYFLPFVTTDPDAYRRGESPVPSLRSVVGYASPGRVIMIMETRNRSEIDALVDIISEKFREVPGMISFASRGSIFASNLGGSRSINLDISGPELAPLFEVGLESFLKTRTIFDEPQIRPDPSNLTMGQPLLEVRPDWERAAELGFEANDLGYSIWALSDGAYVDEFFLGDDKIDMFLFGTGGTLARPEDLDNLLIYSPNGGIVPLSAVAAVRETVNTETILRVDGERTVTIHITPPRDIPLETAVETVQREIVHGLRAAGKVPDEVSVRISGASDRLQATRQALSGNFLVAVLISYLLMVAIFSHWGYPLIIMTSVPIGISGGIVGLWLLNAVGGLLPAVGMAAIRQPFDVITMLGFLVLIGTVVNNPILMVEKTLTNLRQRSMSIADAVVDAVQSRLRPIIMSSITTICGLSPLVLLPGAGTELYRGLGTIVLFGILFSTIVTLTFMPSLLSLVLHLFERRAAAREQHVTT